MYPSHAQFLTRVLILYLIDYDAFKKKYISFLPTNSKNKNISIQYYLLLSNPNNSIKKVSTKISQLNILYFSKTINPLKSSLASSSSSSSSSLYIRVPIKKVMKTTYSIENINSSKISLLRICRVIPTFPPRIKYH